MKFYWFKLTLAYLLLISSLVGLDHHLKAAQINKKNPQPQFSVHNVKAYDLFKSGEYSKAYAQAILAKQDAIFNNDPYQLARALSNIASTTLYLGNSEKALDLYLESLDISRKNLDINGEESTLNNIAAIYVRLEKFEEAQRYYEQLPVLNGIDRPDYQRAVAHTGLLNIYLEYKELDKARTSLQTLTILFENYDHSFIKFYYLLGYARLLKLEDRDELVKKKISQAEQLATENGFLGLQVIAVRNKAEFLIDIKQWAEAKSIILKAINIAKDQKLNFEIVELYELLVNIEKNQKNYHEAIKKMELINQLEIDISGEKIRQLAEITKIDRQVLKTEEKLRETQQQEKILSLKLEKQKQNKLIWLGVFIVLFISIFFYYYRINSQRVILQQRKINDKLKELDRVKDRILKNTSHELRTPLNGIIGLSDILLQDPNNHFSEENKGLLKVIKSSGEQLSLVINDILEMSNLKNKIFTINNSEFNLVELINDVVAVCLPLADEKNIQLNYKADQNIDNIFQDKKRLQQILFNIIGNAVKFTEEGVVNIENKMIENNLQIKIVDTGIGIPQEKIESVFKGFEQVDSGNTRNKQGSGLGLAISRDIAIAMGGKLELVSKLNQGTTVTLYLPLI